MKAVLARAGDCWCALPLERLRRILPAVRLHPLPGAGLEVAGLAEIDGEPVVVLSLERLAGAPPGPSAEYPVTVVVEAGVNREVVALAVDEAGEIVRLDEVAAIADSGVGVVRGEAAVGERIVRVVDVAVLGRRPG